MKFKNKKPIISLSILSSAGFILALVSGLVFSTNQIAQVEAQTLPPNVNVSDLNDAQVNTYYNGVSGLSGDNLVAALNEIIDGHREYDYESDADRTAYKIIDRNWELSPLSPSQLSNYNYKNDNPFIRKFYADYNDSALTANRYKNDGASRVSFDKEHLWAQSLGAFGRDGGAGSDFHSLVPSDIKGNQQMHSNYNFATPTLSITNYDNDYDTYVGRAGYISGGENKVCEPLDEYKGDIARAMFYMPTRYYTYEDVLHPKLTLVNGSPDAVIASSYQDGLAGDLQTLLEWNELDPVDEYEIHRNNLIYNNFQLNRNPFIDHPEWARIAFDTSYSGSGASIAPESSSVGADQDVFVESITFNTSSRAIVLGGQYSIVATVSPVNAGNKTLAWESSNESVATVTNEGVVTALSLGTTTITARSTDAEIESENVSATCEITVTATKNLEYISVSGAVSSATYGSEYNTSSIMVTAYYDNQVTEDVTSEATIGTPNTQILGEQSIEVSFENKLDYYNVIVTNHNAVVSEFLNYEGEQYISPTAAGGAIDGWAGFGLGSAYADESVKFDSAGDYIIKSDIWSGNSSQNVKSIDLVIRVRQNGGTAELTENELEVIAFNNSVTVGSVSQIAGFSTSTGGNEEALTIALSSASTVTGLKVLYKTKVYGNLGIYYVNATPTYESYPTLSQAEAWSNYFLNETHEQCIELEPQFSSVWTTLANEYNWMGASAKSYFTSGQPSAIIQAAIDRYNAIINAHPENVGFISGLSSANTRTYINQTNDFAFLIFAFVVIGTGILFIAFNKKKFER